MSNIIHVVEVLAQGSRKSGMSSANAKIVSCTQKTKGVYLVKVEAKADLLVKSMPLVKGRVQALGLTLLNVVSYVCYKESVSGKRTEIPVPVGSFAEKEWALPDLGGMSNEEVLQTLREVFGISAKAPRSMLDDLMCV